MTARNNYGIELGIDNAVCERIHAAVEAAKVKANTPLTWPQLAEGEWFEFLKLGRRVYRRREGTGYQCYRADGTKSDACDGLTTEPIRRAGGLHPHFATHNAVVTVSAEDSPGYSQAPVGTFCT